MGFAEVPEKQQVTTVMTEGEDLALLGSGTATIGQSLFADGGARLLFNDLSAGSSGSTLAGYIITADGVGGVDFLPNAQDSLLVVTVGVGGDYATFGTAIDAVESGTNTYAVILIIGKVSWANPTQIITKPLIFRGITEDAEINIDTNVNVIVDYGATDMLASFDFQSLKFTRESSATGGFSMTTHDTILRINDCTITDSTTNPLSQGIFDGDTETLTVVLENVIIDSAGSQASFLSRWASADVTCINVFSDTTAQFMESITSATLTLDGGTILNDVGLSGTTLSLIYGSDSLLINVAGGGTISSVSGSATYNSTIDALSTVTWDVVLDSFTGPAINIGPGTFTTAADNIIISQTCRISGAGRDRTRLESSTTTGTRIFFPQGPGSIIEDISIVSTSTGNVIRVFETSVADITVRNARIEYQSTSDTNITFVFLNVAAHNTRFEDCEFLMGILPQFGVDLTSTNRTTFIGCDFIHTGSGSNSSLLIDGTGLTAGAVVDILNCTFDAGASTGTDNNIFSGSGSSKTCHVIENKVSGQFREFFRDANGLINSIIQGNHIDTSLGGFASTSVVTIAGVMSNLIISDNVFSNCAANGIQLQPGGSAGTLVTISNNIILGNGTASGLRIGGDLQQSVVRGNVIDNFSIGLETYNSSTFPNDNLYTGNHLQGNATPASIHASDTSSVAHNVEL